MSWCGKSNVFMTASSLLSEGVECSCCEHKPETFPMYPSYIYRSTPVNNGVYCDCFWSNEGCLLFPVSKLSFLFHCCVSASFCGKDTALEDKRSHSAAINEPVAVQLPGYNQHPPIILHSRLSTCIRVSVVDHRWHFSHFHDFTLSTGWLAS